MISRDQNKKYKNAWETCNDLLINQSLFKKGILLIRSQKLQDSNEAFSNTRLGFKFNDREFYFEDRNPELEIVANKRTVKIARNLLKHIDDGFKSDIFIFNAKRKDEIFLPVIINDKEKMIGFYIFPWVEKNILSSFQGFNRFVTGGCLFGSSLKAVDQSGNKFILIRHHLNPSKIYDIDFDESGLNVYEEALFSELENIAILINKFSTKDARKELFFHLPSYDYLLFGIKLFINGKMSLYALEKFINLVFGKAESYRIRLMDLFSSNIELFIQSPFDNLVSVKNNLKDILSTLNLSTDECFYECLNEEEKEKIEKRVAHQFLTELVNNNHNLVQKQVWQDFIEAANINSELSDIENLFKLANVVMLGVAAHKMQDNKVCSLVPLSEKQIQVNYAQMRKKHNRLRNDYPAIFHMTYMDPIIIDANNSSTLFYFDRCQETLCNLVKNKKMLEYMHKNISLFAAKSNASGTEKPYKIHEVINLNRNMY